MKKLLLLAVFIFVGVSSYAQQVVKVRNASPCEIKLRVENHEICSDRPIYQSVTVPAGAIITVNTVSPGATEITGVHILTNSGVFVTSPEPKCLRCPSLVIGPPSLSWIDSKNCTSKRLNYYSNWYCDRPGVSSYLDITI